MTLCIRRKLCDEWKDYLNFELLVAIYYNNHAWILKATMNRLAEAAKRLRPYGSLFSEISMHDWYCSECYNTILLYQIGYSIDISPAGNKAHCYWFMKPAFYVLAIAARIFIYSRNSYIFKKPARNVQCTLLSGLCYSNIKMQWTISTMKSVTMNL